MAAVAEHACGQNKPGGGGCDDAAAATLSVPLPAATVQEALRASAHLVKGAPLDAFDLQRNDSSWLIGCLQAADFLGAPQLTAAVLDWRLWSLTAVLRKKCLKWHQRGCITS